MSHFRRVVSEIGGGFGKRGSVHGYAVDIEGDRAVIGAHKESPDGTPHAGIAYTYTRTFNSGLGTRGVV